MLTLTLLIDQDGKMLYKSNHNHVKVIGEFLIKDARIMPDFIRAFLTTDDEETMELDACLIETNNKFFIIKHFHFKNLPTVTLTKERMLQVLDIWEDFLMEKKAPHWIFFNEEEFGLPPLQEKISKKWEEMEEKISPILPKKNNQKEGE